MHRRWTRGRRNPPPCHAIAVTDGDGAFDLCECASCLRFVQPLGRVQLLRRPAGSGSDVARQVSRSAALTTVRWPGTASSNASRTVRGIAESPTRSSFMPCLRCACTATRRIQDARRIRVPAWRGHDRSVRQPPGNEGGNVIEDSVLIVLVQSVGVDRDEGGAPVRRGQQRGASPRHRQLVTEPGTGDTSRLQLGPALNPGRDSSPQVHRPVVVAQRPRIKDFRLLVVVRPDCQTCPHALARRVLVGDRCLFDAVRRCRTRLGLVGLGAQRPRPSFRTRQWRRHSLRR